MTGLQGKVALITGAKGGLGTYVTNTFLDAGSNVAGTSRSIRDADFTHPRFSAVPAELLNSAAAVSVVETVISRFGRIDILVHLIGAFAGGAPIAETDDKTLDDMLNVNLRSTFHVVRAVLPYMRKQGSGRLIAIGSRAAVDSNANAGAYSASKAALIALLRAVAIENRSHGIAANVLLPGTMDTPANRAASPAADFSKWVSPAQVARAIAWLAADETGEVSGATIPVYGSELS
jgi:NAD(P)-dependent dehydrogenase (short-subunit alcohol dehydrogenase family)